MATKKSKGKGKKSTAPSAKADNKGKPDIIAEIVEALGDSAPKKTGKTAAYHRAVALAAADESNKEFDKRYAKLSAAAKAWLEKAVKVLQQDAESDVPDPADFEADKSAAAEDAPEEEEEEAAEEEEEEAAEEEEEEEEEEPAPKKKGKGKAKKPIAAAEEEEEEPAPKKKGKGKATKKKSGKKTESTKDLTAAIAFAKKLQAKDEGPVKIIRAIALKFKDFERRDVMALADELGMNKYTASRQFHVARSGGE